MTTFSRRGIVVFVDAEELAHQALLAKPAGIGHLERLDLEERVEDRMRDDPGGRSGASGSTRRIAASNTFHSFGKWKSSDDEEPALGEVLAEALTSASLGNQ